MLALNTRPRRKRGLNIAAIPNCELWIDCAKPETLTFSSGVNVSEIKDLSGKNRPLTKTGAGNETVYPTYVAAERGVSFLNTAFDQMISGTNGDWNFLHNGNGCSVVMLVKIDSTQAANAAVLSTSSEAASGVGTNIWYYNTNQNYHISTRNGSGQPFFNSGANNSLVKNSPTILSMHMELRTGNPPDLITRYNGTTDLRNANLTTLSAANSTGPLFISKLAEGTAKCKLTLKKIAIFSRRISKAEENLILEDWSRSENITITRYGDAPLAILAGQSNAKGRGLIADTEFATTPSVVNASIFNATAFTWTTLQAGTNNDAFSNSTLGLEMNLARQYTTLSAQPLYLVKYAVDGTSMTSWDSANSNFINLQTAMKKAYWNLEDAGYVPKPFLIWYQGESDAQDSTLAANYATNLQQFFTQLLTIPGYPQTATYIVQIHQSPPAIGTDSVRNAQLITSLTTPYSAYLTHIEIDDIVDHIDQHHMKASTLNALGNRIARKVLKING
jgi:Carbohydrate esterase, sialic acid-specific acetylesterase